jgi:hypothetical protein
MESVIRYRQYAADCIRQAQAEEAIEDRTILLNVALAWLRLAQQIELRLDETSPPAVLDYSEVLVETGQHEMAF